MSTNCCGSFDNVALLSAINFYERLNEIRSHIKKKLQKLCGATTEKKTHNSKNCLLFGKTEMFVGKKTAQNTLFYCGKLKIVVLFSLLG